MITPVLSELISRGTNSDRTGVVILHRAPQPVPNRVPDPGPARARPGPGSRRRLGIPARAWPGSGSRCRLGRCAALRGAVQRCAVQHIHVQQLATRVCCVTPPGSAPSTLKMISQRNSITAPGSCQGGGSGTLGFTRFHKGSRQSHDSDPEPCEMGWPVRNLQPCFTRF